MQRDLAECRNPLNNFQAFLYFNNIFIEFLINLSLFFINFQTMLDKEKKRFHEMAEKDKARYDLEMSNYVPPKGVIVGRGKKRKHLKDPNAPKRSL